MDSPNRKYAVTTEVTFVAEGMSFEPDKPAFKSGIEKLLSDMKSAVEDIQPINLHSDL